MKNHTDREVRLSTESEYKNLYGWSIQEWSNEGQRIGADQVPWHWTLHFSATGVRHVSSFELERSASSDTEGPKHESSDHDWISAELKPEAGRRTTYSMFGTGRAIEAFSLRIKALPEGETGERCWVWGGVSYTMEIDFGDITEPDSIEIEVHVSADRYASLKQAVKEPSTSEISISLKGVSGFYSDWSPSISTSNIKVLTESSDHSVIVPPGCPIEPLRLGPVSEFTLAVVRARSLAPKKPGQDVREERETQQENSFPVESAQSTESVVSSGLQDIKESLSGLKVSLWICVALLTYMAFR